MIEDELYVHAAFIAKKKNSPNEKYFCCNIQWRNTEILFVMYITFYLSLVFSWKMLPVYEYSLLCNQQYFSPIFDTIGLCSFKPSINLNLICLPTWFMKNYLLKLHFSLATIVSTIAFPLHLTQSFGLLSGKILHFPQNTTLVCTSLRFIVSRKVMLLYSPCLFYISALLITWLITNEL